MNPVEIYIGALPSETQNVLTVLRSELKKCAPEAVDAMSYGVPALKMKNIIIIYAAFKNHIGIYPTPPVIEELKDELTDYKTTKGAIQFPLDKPLPYPLITKIMKVCIEKYG